MPRERSAKDALLEAALAVHAERGPEGFTIHAVVEASGKSLGSLYHHFGSFDGLAAATYARSLGALLEALGEALARTRTAERGLEAIVRAYLDFTREHRPAALFVHAQGYASFVPRHAAAIAEAREPRLAPLLAWALRHVEAGELLPLPPPLFEMLVIGPVAETARRWLAGDPSIDLDEAARLLAPRIWAAVAVAPRPRRA